MGPGGLFPLGGDVSGSPGLGDSSLSGTERDVDDEVGKREPLQVDHLPVHSSAGTIDLDLGGGGEEGDKKRGDNDRNNDYKNRVF